MFKSIDQSNYREDQPKPGPNFWLIIPEKTLHENNNLFYKHSEAMFNVEMPGWNKMRCTIWETTLCAHQRLI